MVRVFLPEKCVRVIYGRYSNKLDRHPCDEADYVAWTHWHPELFCSGSKCLLCVLCNSDVTYPLSFPSSLEPESRHVQQFTLKVSPADQLHADDESSLYVSSGNHHVLREGSRRYCSPSIVVSHGSYSGTSSTPCPPSLITIGVLAAGCFGCDV
jgi:hypothetical protein